MLTIIRTAIDVASKLGRQYSIGFIASEAGFQLTVQVERDLLTEAR